MIDITTKEIASLSDLMWSITGLALSGFLFFVMVCLIIRAFRR